MSPTRRRRRSGTATVHVHVHEVAQLYNSLDPSPFWDRDLDRDAAEFIEGEFSDRLGAEHWHLLIHVSASTVEVQALQKAVASYYHRLAASARRQLSDHLRRARLGLFAGLALFALFMVARNVARAMIHDLPAVIDEGLIILAWLSVWRPAEMLAYEWLPLHRRRRLYERLSTVRVTAHTDAEAIAPGNGTHDGAP